MVKGYHFKLYVDSEVLFIGLPIVFHAKFFNQNFC